MTIEIDASILKDFISKVTVNNKMSTARFTTTSDGMFTRLIDEPKHIVTEGILNPSAFHKYEENITLNIRDTTRFSKILGSFKDKINVSVKDIHILLRGVNKTSDYKLGNEIPNHLSEKGKTEWDSGVNIPLSFLKEIKADLGNVDADCVMLEIKDKVLTATIKGQEDLMTNFMNVEYKDCKFVMASSYFNDIITLFDNDNINISFQNLELYDKNPPLQIIEKGKTHKLSVWVAPFRSE